VSKVFRIAGDNVGFVCDVTEAVPMDPRGAVAAPASTADARRPAPVPQQRSHRPPSGDLQSEQFKRYLAEMAANRRPLEDGGGGRERPAVVPRGGSVDSALETDAGSAAAWRTGAAALRQNARAATIDDPSVPQRRSVEIARHGTPPSSASATAAAQMMMADDFDLPPPPEEYCNLPEMTAAAADKPLPPPPAASRHAAAATADWQREIAGRFHAHPHHPTAPAPTAHSKPLLDHHDLPPPPSGFLDDVPSSGPPSRATPAAARTGGLAANAGGGGLSAGAAGGGSMSRWSGDDVVRWLETLSMPEHCPAFSENSIDGEQLVRLTDDDLYALGVTQFGQRKMLQRAIVIENRAHS